MLEQNDRENATVDESTLRNILYRMRLELRIILIIGITMLLTGCPDPLGILDDDDSGSRRYTPIYLPYTELRSSVEFQAPRAIGNIGRVYIFGDKVFLNEKNNGIHVLDNSNPITPVNAGFINIPGNTEVSIKNGFLYADSYVDLVTVDVNDVNNIREVSRQEGIFPWDAFQNVPDSVYFGDDQIDETIGVVIGYDS